MLKHKTNDQIMKGEMIDATIVGTVMTDEVDMTVDIVDGMTVVETIIAGMTIVMTVGMVDEI